MNRRTSGLSIASALATTVFFTLLLLARMASSQASSQGVVISEVAWAGTLHSPNDEWIELYNAGADSVDLTGWRLEDSSGDLAVSLAGTIGPGHFFLLERTDDSTVSDVVADQIYTGWLNNSGEALTLFDSGGVVVDTANGGGGSWPAGWGSPDYVSMERVSPSVADEAGAWLNNDRVTVNGTDAGGNTINGTPRAMNSAWTSNPDDEADLAVDLFAPEFVTAGGLIRYELQLSNVGQAVAEDVVLTGTLPAGVDYVADDSGLAVDVSALHRPIWFAGAVDPGGVLSFALTATVAVSSEGTVVTALRAGSTSRETTVANNLAQAATFVVATGVGPVVLHAVLYDGYELNDSDEAVQLVNAGMDTISIYGWSISDGSGEAIIQEVVAIAPSEAVWLAKDAVAFARQFGFAPDVELDSWPGFANQGDEVMLRDRDGRLVDVLVYKDGDTSVNGWSGPAVWPYRVSGLFAEEGQILFRRLDEVSGLPVPDTDGADDWAQMRADPVEGRKVQYPGWNIGQFSHPVMVSDSGTLTVAVAPDNAFQALVQQIEGARQRIQIETLTMESMAVGQALADAAGRGVAVTILLEGSPAGGIADQERYICRQIEERGGACWFMIRDDALRIHDRYRFLHAKFMVIDERRAVISTENLSPRSLPDDNKSDGTWGRRGLLLITDAEGVVERLMQLFADDLAPAVHQDLFRWYESHAVYGAPADNFVPITSSGGTTYTVRYAHPVAFHDATSLSLFHAPENMLRRSDGLLALLRASGAGDTILAQQLTERRHWGPSSSNAVDDPNPRLEAMIEAARRGATVRLMLDSFFDRAQDPLSNSETCRYVNQVASEESLRLRCRVANPAGLGIHNKMVLLQLGGRGWVHVGSWNGTEQSTKGNREVAVQVQSDAAFAYLASLFEQDWPHRYWFPVLMHNFKGPANHALISELMYDPSGPDDAEFIEIANPTRDAVDLSAWTLSDAVSPEDFEDARLFPEGTWLAPRSALVVALSAAAFEAYFGFLPDFEILDSRAGVADLLDDPRWGDPAAVLQMGNSGDEVLLRSPTGGVVDVVVYGAGSYPGMAPCPLAPGSGYSLERVPYWRDSNDCSSDFRAWPLPSPGLLP